jgi:membrane associated rhomboid family serine protease
MLFPLRGAPALRRQPLATLGLIAVNVAIYIYQSRLGPQAGADLVLQQGAVAAKLSQPHLLFSYQGLRLLPTMFSSLFLHGGMVHLVGNMWFLWLFGEALEDDLGHGRFLAFYLFCGFFAGLFHVLGASLLRAPLIGASGAIAGVLGGYLRRLPQSPIHTLIFFRLRPEMVRVPAYAWLGLWLVLQFYGLRQGGPVAWIAHLGGFFIGLVTVNYFTPVETGKPLDRKEQPARKSGRKAKGRKPGKKQVAKKPA